MIRIALNIICKNESHIIERMLGSALPLIDLIVAVDTGSTDDTIRRIETFGEAHRIPTYVYQRPFDNFCNSRNYALDKLKETVDALGWDRAETFGFNADCDEIIKVLPAFDKNAITHDMLVLRQRIGRETFTRQGIFRLSKDFYWQSPVHEEIVWRDPLVSKKYEFSIEIIEEPAGASWKGNLEEKFLRYASMLKAHIAQGNRNFRSVYFLGDSYNAAAAYCTSPEKATELYQAAEVYLQQAAAIVDDSREVKFMLYKKIAENRIALCMPWPAVKEFYLKAYEAHLFKAETLAEIIEHYLESNQGELAYYYARYAYTLFATHLETTGTTLYVNESLYQWKLLYYYYKAAMITKRSSEGKALFRQIRKLQQTHPGYFDKEDLLLLNINSPAGLKIAVLRETITNLFKRKRKESPPRDTGLLHMPSSQLSTLPSIANQLQNA